MGQEFVIKSQKLEDKVNQLLPSQGGAQAGVDLSASSTIIPIIDLTETAEGSDVRADIQAALSLTSITSFNFRNTTSTLVNTTGYYRVFGTMSASSDLASTEDARFTITDGTTSKDVVVFTIVDANRNPIINFYDFIVFLEAGDSLTGNTSSNRVFLQGNTRQIADISGNLINP